MEAIIKNATSWLTDFFDSTTQEEIKGLMQGNTEELKDRFYKNLEFGTGGMRGIMGAGTNRINKYTLGKNTQGLSDYLKKSFPNTEDRKSTRLNSSHVRISYAVFCLKKKTNKNTSHYSPQHI